MTFGSTLRKIRKARRISQQQLAGILNVSQRTISHYENATSQPSLENFCLIADVLGVSCDMLLGRIEISLD